ncbi:biopolymer transporter ExbD [Pirellulaceae bacterium SH467]
MSIRLTCPECQSALSVNNRLSGREIRCPHCNGSITVPGKQLESEPKDAPESHSPSSPFANKSIEPEKSTTSEDELLEPAELAEPTGAEGIETEEIEVAELVLDSASGTTGTKRDPVSSPRSSSLLLGSLEQVSLELEREQSLLADGEDEAEEISFPKKELPKDDMDMTPMVDVTFLLLIFFMITASFSKEKVFEEPPPLSDNAAMATEPPPVFDLVRVQIDEFNGYTIILPGGDEREASSKQDLLLALSDARAEVVTGANEDQLKLMIEAHVDCIHAAVVAALDAGRDKGFTNFQVQVVEEFQ